MEEEEIVSFIIFFFSLSFRNSSFSFYYYFWWLRSSLKDTKRFVEVERNKNLMVSFLHCLFSAIRFILIISLLISPPLIRCYLRNIGINCWRMSRKGTRLTLRLRDYERGFDGEGGCTWNESCMSMSDYSRSVSLESVMNVSVSALCPKEW